MTSLWYMQLATWSFTVWAGTWVAVAFLPGKNEASSVPDAIIYVALAIWMISYWVLHISFAKAKGYSALTGIGYALFSILGLILLAIRKDRSL